MTEKYIMTYVIRTFDLNLLIIIHIYLFFSSQKPIVQLILVLL